MSESESESVIMNYFYYFNYYYDNYNNWFQGRNERWLKIGMGLCGLCLVGYIVGPPLYYHLSESLSTTAAAAVSTAPVCRPCFCDCSSQPLFSLHEGYFFYFLLFFFLITNFITNCLSSFYCIWDFVGLLTWMSIFILGPNLKVVVLSSPWAWIRMMLKKKKKKEMFLYTPYFF